MSTRQRFFFGPLPAGVSPGLAGAAGLETAIGGPGIGTAWDLHHVVFTNMGFDLVYVSLACWGEGQSQNTAGAYLIKDLDIRPKQIKPVPLGIVVEPFENLAACQFNYDPGTYVVKSFASAVNMWAVGELVEP